MTYKCKQCGGEHFDFPALTFNSPYHYHTLSAEDKAELAELTNDFCMIHHAQQTDRFIRVVLYQKIIDSCENLSYGVWVSLSEKSYNDYKKNFENESHTVTYFGYLCNQIPPYDNTLSIKTTVYTQEGDARPEIRVHAGEYDNHEFAKDFFDGITQQEALKRVEAMMEQL